MKKLLIHGEVLSMENRQPLISDGAIGIEDDQICYMGETPDITVQESYDEIIDLKGKLVLPGLINTHNHAAMTLLRGYADDLPLQTWLEEKIWPQEAKFTKETVRAGAALAALEMIQSGTSCFLDMYDHMDAVAEVVLESGLRASLCRGVIGFGDEDVLRDKLSEAVQFALEWNGEGDGRIQTLLAPHSPYTCPPQYIVQFIEKAKELNLPLHTHMSETQTEVELNLREYGERPVEHLRKLGFFDQPAVVAHAVHVNDEEIDILRQYGVKIAHNPKSNLKLGSGVAPINQMLKKGIRPGVATDGASSNNNMDLLQELQLAALIHKGVHQDPEMVPAYTALEMGTLYGAETLFREQEIGSLAVGKKADLITMDIGRPHFQPVHDLISHVVYAASSQDVQDVYVDGKQLMRDREVLSLDEEKIIYEAKKAFSELG